MSSLVLGPKSGAGSVGADLWPIGRMMSVPLTTHGAGATVTAEGEVLPADVRALPRGRKILPMSGAWCSLA
jgi:hypothetical protein